MRCLEVHHSLNTEPSKKTEEVLNHLKICPECKRYARQLDQFEHNLSNQLRIVAPEGLAYRILLNQNLKTHQHNQQTRRRWYGIAASIALTLTLVSGVLYFNQPDSLDQIALLHVKNEQHHLTDKNNIQLTALNHILNPLRIKLDQSIGTINYAGTCQIGSHRGGHIVIQGETAPITLLLMPGEHIPHKEKVKGENYKGIIFPVETGSIALIGEGDTDLEPLLNKIKMSLRAI